MARGAGIGRAGGAVGYLMARGGAYPAVMPAPMRPGDPMPTGAQYHIGPNLTDYQKQLFLSLQQSIPVIQPTAFQRLNVIGFNLTAAGGDVQALTAPPEIRAFLAIRNDASSPGVLLIAMDTVALATTAAFSLNPGGVIFFDTFVPQNDIHLATAAGVVGTVVAVVSYANARFRPSGS